MFHLNRKSDLEFHSNCLRSRKQSELNVVLFSLKSKKKKNLFSSDEFSLQSAKALSSLYILKYKTVSWVISLM